MVASTIEIFGQGDMVLLIHFLTSSGVFAFLAHDIFRINGLACVFYAKIDIDPTV